MISLIPRTLMNLLVAVYDDELSPKDFFMSQLVEPYYFTFEQLEIVVDTIFWPGSLRASSKHPSYSILKQLNSYVKADSHAMVDSSVIKNHFIYAATSICHAWYKEKNTKTGRYVLSKNPHFVAYQEPGLAVPFVWLSIDNHGMVQLFQRNKWMPPLRIDLFRTTTKGDLFPLKFFPHLIDEGKANFVCLEFCVYDQNFLQMGVTQNSKHENFVVFVSEDMTLVRSFLVSPSCGKTWSIPVVMHKFE